MDILIEYKILTDFKRLHLTITEFLVFDANLSLKKRRDDIESRHPNNPEE